MKKVIWYTMTFSLMLLGLFKNVQGSEMNISEELSIVGFQISSNVILHGENVGVGVRTICYHDTEIQGKQVEAFGLIYGLNVNENVYDDMKLHSENPYIYAMIVTEEGKITKPFDAEETDAYYAIIMPVYNGLTQEYYVRPYVILSDETVVYGHIESYSAYRIADYLYQNVLESSIERHNALFEKVLKKAQENYEEVPYDYGKTIMPAKKEPAYYLSFEEALEDAKQQKIANANANKRNAKASLMVDGEKTVVILYGNVEMEKDISIPMSLSIDLNDYRISSNNGSVIYYEQELHIQKGMLDFENGEKVLDGTGGEDSLLELYKVEIVHKNVLEDQRALTITAKNIQCKNSRIHAEGDLNTRAIYAVGETVTVKSTEITVNGKYNNGFGIVVAENGEAVLQNNVIDIAADMWSIGIYATDSSKNHLKRNEILCHGSMNNVPVYINAFSNVSIDSGGYRGTPVSQSGLDSYGTAIYNLGTVQIEGGEFLGGNSGIQCGQGSRTTINGGTFKSPNHGGIYAACGSEGFCEIGGGSFICNRGEYSQSELGNIVSFGAGYFGCSGQSKAWNVNIRNAYFENNYGNGIVQKSNDNYVPASLNLYGCTIKARDYSIWIQNNESVDLYNTYISLYDNCKMTGRIYDERATVTGYSRINYFY